MTVLHLLRADATRVGQGSGRGIYQGSGCDLLVTLRLYDLSCTCMPLMDELGGGSRVCEGSGDNLKADGQRNRRSNDINRTRMFASQQVSDLRKEHNGRLSDDAMTWFDGKMDEERAEQGKARWLRGEKSEVD